MRATLGALLALVVAAPAQARYLHMSAARPAAHAYVAWAEFPTSHPTLGRCWHAGPHTVQCSYTMVGVTVCNKAVSNTCKIDFVNEPGVSHWIVTIAQRRDGLYAHRPWVDNHSFWIAPLSGRS